MAHQISPPPQRPQYQQAPAPAQSQSPQLSQNPQQHVPHPHHPPPGQAGQQTPQPQPQPQQQQTQPQQAQPQPHSQHAPSAQPVTRPYSPYQSTQPGSPAIALPPNKRQRLSPNPSSPQTLSYTSPDAPYHSTPYPNTPYHQNTPYNGNPYSPIAAPSPPPFNAPQPYVQSPVPGGAMGPPPRPNPEKVEKEEKEKIHDISDVTDVFHGSGIDLREEENYMSNTFRNSHSGPSYNTSFGSSTTNASPNNSFNYLNQGSFGSQPAFSGSGPISQPIASQEDMEKDIEHKHAAAARELAVSRQAHLKDSFLVSNRIRHRMHQIAYEQGVALNVDGLFDKIEPAYHNLTQTGPNGQAIAAIKEPHSRVLQEKPKDGFLQETAPLADILTLVSVAANERIRSLTDDAYRLARGRRYGSHGVVPHDLADLAIGDNPKSISVQPSSINDSAWEGSLKRTSDGIVKPESRADSASPAPTVSFSESLSKHLLSLAIHDRDAERERIRKREDRAKRAAVANNEDGPPSATADGPPTSATGTPSAAATPMPEAAAQVAPEKPLTKKERERQAKLGQTEEVLHKNANTTAAMALGLGKKGKKKYSWMNGGAPAAPSNPYKQASKSVVSPVTNGSSAGKSPAAGSDPGVDKALQVRDRKWGGWREDGIEGRGIQIRDWVQVLERDGREKKALQKVLLNLNLDDAQPSATSNGQTPQPGQ